MAEGAQGRFTYFALAVRSREKQRSLDHVPRPPGESDLLLGSIRKLKEPKAHFGGHAASREEG